jgi:hypothetical protein
VSIEVIEKEGNNSLPGIVVLFVEAEQLVIDVRRSDLIAAFLFHQGSTIAPEGAFDLMRELIESSESFFPSNVIHHQTVWSLCRKGQALLLRGAVRAVVPNSMPHSMDNFQAIHQVICLKPNSSGRVLFHNHITGKLRSKLMKSTTHTTVRMYPIAS